jgi:DNA polymerase III epsilon subunit-like protein
MIIIDIEATGTNAQKHSIVSLGAIDFKNPTRQLYLECRRFEGAHIMDGALEVNGFTEEEIDDQEKMSESELFQQFMEWSYECDDRTLVGQNIAFDRAFLAGAAERAGQVFDIPYRTIDTHSLCFMHMIKRGIIPPFDAQHKRTALNLDAVLNYCGIPDEPDPHNALTGAKCHGETASRLLYDKPLLRDFEHFPIPWLSK